MLIYKKQITYSMNSNGQLAAYSFMHIHYLTIWTTYGILTSQGSLKKFWMKEYSMLEKSTGQLVAFRGTIYVWTKTCNKLWFDEYIPLLCIKLFWNFNALIRVENLKDANQIMLMYNTFIVIKFNYLMYYVFGAKEAKWKGKKNKGH